MADPTLNNYIRNTMRDDATIRGLTAETVSPYGVYYQHPKKDVEPSLITFSTIARSREAQISQMMIIGITAWGDNFEEIQNTVYNLFHKTAPVLIDYRILIMKFIGSSPELWDERLQCFYRQDRYQIILARD